MQQFAAIPALNSCAMFKTSLALAPVVTHLDLVEFSLVRIRYKVGDACMHKTASDHDDSQVSDIVL